jgi:hypothetical protein
VNIRFQNNHSEKGGYQGRFYGTLINNNGITISNNRSNVTASDFVNAGASNFRLANGTNASVNTGLVVAGINDANSESPYAGSGPDLGAYEWNGVNWTAGSTLTGPAVFPNEDITPVVDVWYYVRNQSHGGNRNLQAKDVNSNWDVVTSPNTGGWEKWKLVDAGSGRYFLRNSAHGGTRNLRAGNSAESWNVTTTTNTASYELWELRNAGGGWFFIRSTAHSRNLQARLETEGYRVQTDPNTGSWEKWQFVLP